MVRQQSSVADCWSPKLIDPGALGEREAKVIIKRTANDVGQVKRSSSRNFIYMDIQAQPFSRREPIVTKPSKMALSIGPVYQP